MKKKFLIYIAIFIIILIGCLSYKAPTKSEFVQVPENIIIPEEELIEADVPYEWNIPIPKEFENNPDEYLNKYYTDATLLGGTTRVIVQESNYNQFNSYKETDDLIPYSSPININICTFNELYMSDNNTYLSDHIKYQNDHLNEMLTYYSRLNSNVKKDQKCIYKLTGMLIVTEENNKPEKIRVTINNQSFQEFVLNPETNYNTFDLDYTQENISKPISIKIEVLSTFNNTDINNVIIKDIEFGIDSNIPQGR